MNKLNKKEQILNIVLGVLYIPMSVFSWFLQMAFESTIDATNLLYICVIYIFTFISFIIPFLCIAGFALSELFRKKGNRKLSLVVRFVPLIVFVLNFILLVISETIPSTI